MSSTSTRPHKVISRAAALILSSVCATSAFAADKGLLGNELAELEQAVNAISPQVVATTGTGSEEIVVKPADPNEPQIKVTSDPDHVVVMRGTPGRDGLPELPPGSVITLPDGKTIKIPEGMTLDPGGPKPPPVTVIAPDVNVAAATATAPAKGLVADEDWYIEKEGGPSMRDGLMVFNAPNEDHAPTVTRRRNLKGDFDLRVDYTLEATDAKKMVGAAFGIRLDSPTREGQITIDRRNDPDMGGDTIRVGRSGELKPALTAKPTSNGGAIRIQRRGDRYKIFHGSPDGLRWTDLGEVTADLSPEVNLWMVAFTDWAGVRVTVSRVEVKRITE